ncbi:hypothetical protein ACWEQL_21190 [Kitasatospora sp. NPDC004240]
MTVRESRAVATESKNATDQPAVAERVTAGLTAKGSAALRDVVSIEQVNKTDAINRALRLYAHLLSRIEEGREVVLRDPNTGQTEVIQFL